MRGMICSNGLHRLGHVASNACSYSGNYRIISALDVGKPKFGCLVGAFKVSHVTPPFICQEAIGYSRSDRLLLSLFPVKDVRLAEPAE